MALNSPNGQLFTAIQDRLVAKATSLKWVDQNFKQLENYHVKPPVLFPCALIDLTGFSFEDMPDGAQKGSGRVVISVGTTPFTSSNMVTPTPQKEKALEFYELEWEIKNVLHNWTPVPGMEKLTARNMDGQEREDTIRERVVVFECGYIDKGAVPVKTTIATPNPFVGGDMLLPT